MPLVVITPSRLFVFLAAVFAALAAWFVPRMEASGDEPHYLVMAQSLWREGDLDLRDNYAREDWREYRSGATEPHYAAPRRDGRPFPGHAPGLPFLFAPVYALGGRLLCAILLGAMVSGTGAIVMRVALREGLSKRASLFAGLVAAGPPLAAFALHIYTEALSALALVGAYALLRFGQGMWSAGAAGALACLLPFLHPRMALGSIAIAASVLALRPRSALSVFASVASLGALFYGLFWMSVFGTPTALGIYGGLPGDAALNPVQAFLGLLFDRAYGLLPYAPAFLGLMLLRLPVRRADSGDRRHEAVEAGFVIAILLPVLFWRVWWGGQSPPARLIAPMTPFLALWLARAFEGATTVARRWLVAGAAWAWGLFLFAALQPGRLLFINRRVRPARMWDALWPGGPLDSLLPDMARPAANDWPLAIAWFLLLGAATFWSRRVSRPPL
jgi:hypothetical protein